MTNTRTDELTPRIPLRLWPGVVVVILQWLARFGVPLVAPDATIFAVLSGLLGGLAVIVWWLFFSRAPWPERWGAVILMIVALVATPRILHVSIATGGMGMLFYILAIPVLSLAFVVWALASRHLSDRPRRATMVVTILLACAVWTLVRTGGLSNDFNNDLAWRWAETPEQQLLAQTQNEAMAPPSAPAAMETVTDWPGFRGPHRDGLIRGVIVETDWSASPPVELWRQPIGPGWSSFAVHGDHFYTQEQRGDDEVVACYSMITGEPVWRHRDAARFWESNGGAGPRGTPTLHDGRVYTFGGTGILNALEAGDGKVVWSRNVAAETNTKVPMWGFSSSPLVVDDVVIVAASGALIAFDLNTGDPRWVGPAGGEGYSSPHLLTIDGVEQIVQLSGDGATGVTPADGTLLWEHPWPGYPIVQPALTADGDLLISVGEKSGIRRIAIALEPGGWTIKERWTSIQLKPYFNDFVVHDGHAFGFAGRSLACIDLKNGQRKWKGTRYGSGQLVLLAEQDLLLVLMEKGELALVVATPEQFKEIARFPAIEGKTWNHPVVAGNTLLVRNSQEMAAFRLSPAATALD